MAKKLVVPPDARTTANKITKRLKSRVIGQERAIHEIGRAMSRAFSGLRDPNRPIAVLAFFGPTGIGKTLTAKELANCWPKQKVWRCLHYQECRFQVTGEEIKAGMRLPEVCPVHSSKANVRAPLKAEEIPNLWTIDCGGLGGSLDHAVTTLMGAPPSYVGYDTPPRFSGKAPRVILFDEAEKALLAKTWAGGQSTFANILLKILDEGRITNNQNEEVDFTKSIIILTGNLGAAEILREFEGTRFGFATTSSNRKSISQMTDAEIAALNERIYSIVKTKAGRELAPEFLNRLTRLVVFHFLTKGDYQRILDLEFAKVQARTTQIATPFAITLNEAAKELLVAEALTDRRFGARPLVRIIEKRVETPLSELVDCGAIAKGDVLEGRAEDGEIVFFRINGRSQNTAQAEAGNGEQL